MSNIKIDNITRSDLSVTIPCYDCRKLLESMNKLQGKKILDYSILYDNKHNAEYFSQNNYKEEVNLVPVTCYEWENGLDGGSEYICFKKTALTDEILKQTKLTILSEQVWPVPESCLQQANTKSS